MLRLPATLRDALRLIASTVGFGGRLIADGSIAGALPCEATSATCSVLLVTLRGSSKLDPYRQEELVSRRLAAPRNQNWSRLGGRDFQAEPLGDASAVNPPGVVLTTDSLSGTR